MRARIVDINDIPPDAEAQADTLATFVHGVFKDEHPAVVGAALVQIVAMHLAGHRVTPDARAALLDVHVRSVREMIPIFDKVAAEFEAKQAGKPS